jgi:TRAP transporter TAXI family solute receptor
MKKWMIFLLIFSIAFISTGYTPCRAQKIELGIAGSGPASLAYTLVAGLAENTNRRTNMVRLTPETTAGYVENVRLLGRGETQLALFGASNIYDGLHSLGAYKGEPPYKAIRGMAVAYVGTASWNAKEGINSIMDLAGKRVSLGPPGSNIADLGEHILKVYGVKDKVGKILRLSYAESSRAFVDGEIDAFMGGPAPYPSVMQAGAQKKITILPVDVAHVKEIAKITPVIPETIPAGAYDWLKKDVLAVGYVTYLGANEKVPEKAVYEILRVNLTPEGIKYLQNNHRLWSMWKTPMYIEEKGAFVVEGLKLHPGAVRYWKEHGVKIPAAILP